MEGSLTDILHHAGITHEPTADRAQRKQALYGPGNEYLGAYDEAEMNAILKASRRGDLVAAFRAAWANKRARAA